MQRCIVHIQRQGLMWCRVNPKTSYARKLRELFLKVTKIWTKKDRDIFLKLVAGWEDKYGQLITNKPDPLVIRTLADASFRRPMPS